jgi:hypothetical protein
MTTENKVLHLVKEKGKCITVIAADQGRGGAIMVWRKNGGILLPLELTNLELIALREMLDSIIS